MQLAQTTECGTAVTIKRYIMSTGHLSNAPWEMQSNVLLLVENLSIRHRADNSAGCWNERKVAFLFPIPFALKINSSWVPI